MSETRNAHRTHFGKRRLTITQLDDFCALIVEGMPEKLALEFLGVTKQQVESTIELLDEFADWFFDVRDLLCDEFKFRW